LVDGDLFEAVRRSECGGYLGIELAVKPAARKRCFANTGVDEENNFVWVLAGKAEAALMHLPAIGKVPVSMQDGRSDNILKLKMGRSVFRKSRDG
jgi:hypothetical protein